MTKKTFLTLLLVMCFCALFADGAFVKSDLYPTEQSFAYANQLGLTNPTTEMPANAALLAVGTPKYPVRPGDVYTLSYYDGSKLVSETIQIDSNYNASISNIGTMSAKGLTYIEFKAKVENQVKTFYSYAKPILTLQSCGIYTVNVTGEVYTSQEVAVWGLTRLSDLAQYATEYASTRDVRITYKDGKTFTYDLFAALRQGKDVQNPYLEPGCTVSFMKAKITVSLSGAVKRPGVYQPQESDTLEYLISAYSSGLTNKADGSSFTVTRYENGNLIMNNILAEEAANFKLQFGDAIYVAERVNDLPVITVEGAVEGGKIYYQYFVGETVEQLVANLSKQLTSDADLNNIQVQRNGNTLSAKTIIKDGDVVIVPYLNQYVTVSGAVRSPGKFLYVPGETSDYYIGLAGGFAESAKRTSLKVYSAEGTTVDAVQPNSTINVNYKDTTAATTVALVSAIVNLAIDCFVLAGYFTK